MLPILILIVAASGFTIQMDEKELNVFIQHANKQSVQKEFSFDFKHCQSSIIGDMCLSQFSFKQIDNLTSQAQLNYENQQIELLSKIQSFRFKSRIQLFSNLILTKVEVLNYELHAEISGVDIELFIQNGNIICNQLQFRSIAIVNEELPTQIKSIINKVSDILNNVLLVQFKSELTQIIKSIIYNYFVNQWQFDFSLHSFQILQDDFSQKALTLTAKVEQHNNSNTIDQKQDL